MIKQGIFVLSMLAVVWLVSAAEFGFAGSWAWVVALGIVFTWVGLIAYAEWFEDDMDKKRERRSDRDRRRIVDQAMKEMFLREIA